MAPSFDRELEDEVRLAALDFLKGATQPDDQSLPWETLVKGFSYHGTRVPLVSMQGIFKPKILALPLSIRSAPHLPDRPRPYDDQLGADGRWDYRYQGKDPELPPNAGLRKLMQLQMPLIYFMGVAHARYVALAPAYIVRDDPKQLIFGIEAQESSPLSMVGTLSGDVALTKRYAMTSQLRRLHQQVFRENVLDAYKVTCAICKLHHRELLDAAHILPDGHPKGDPIVPNGLSLCRLHHAAYDRDLLGIRPDLKIEIRSDILKEKDGPMLVHGIQQFQGELIRIPHSKALQPRREFLEERYSQFLKG